MKDRGREDMSEKKFRNNDVVLDIHDRPSVGQWIGLSIQHLFTMFGATVLVPILVGINPGIALVSSGLGTLVYLMTVTKGKIPAYLGSSFAFHRSHAAFDENRRLPGNRARSHDNRTCLS
jgi:xanthine/uracil permease